MKTEDVKEFVKNKDYKRALRIAKEFRMGISPEDKKRMRKAYECIVNRRFYVQICKDVDAVISDGVETVCRLYG